MENGNWEEVRKNINGDGMGVTWRGEVKRRVEDDNYCD